MTFSQFILSLRRRLQDLRRNSGQIVSDFSEDGIRWSSDQLIEIANESFLDFARLAYRTMLLYWEKKESYPLDLAQIISSMAVTIVSGVGTVATKFLPLTAFSGDSTAQYVSPDKYNKVVNNEEGVEGIFYTFMQDSTGTKIMVSSDGTYTMYGIEVKNDYTLGEGSTTIPYDLFSDMLLDLAEKEAREREGYWDRAAYLEKRILFKLGMAK